MEKSTGKREPPQIANAFYDRGVFAPLENAAKPRRPSFAGLRKTENREVPRSEKTD
jgi:hypothetical protein